MISNTLRNFKVTDSSFIEPRQCWYFF